MRKISVIFLYFLILIFSIFIFALVWGYLTVSMQYLHKTFVIYTITTFIISTIFLRIIIFLENRKPKTEVKIVYKTIDKKQQKDTKKQKEIEIIENIKKGILKGLDENKTDITAFSDKLFENMSRELHIVQGMLFLWDPEKQVYKTVNTYAYYAEDTYREYKLGEGITGQVAKNRKFLYIKNVPEGYITVLSGLGEGSPNYLTFLPIISENQTIAVIEFASFEPLPEPHKELLEAISQVITPYFEKFLTPANNEKK